MVNTIILIRHGESEKDKKNPARRLTKTGKKMIDLVARKIDGLNIGGKMAILTTPYSRTLESAEIISRSFGDLPIIKKDGLRVKNFDKVEKIARGELDLTFFYFRVFKLGKLPKSVSTPEEICDNFLKAISSFSDINTLIIVGHGVALESFALYQKSYLPLKKLKRELGYGEFLILERNPKIKL